MSTELIKQTLTCETFFDITKYVEKSQLLKFTLDYFNMTAFDQVNLSKIFNLFSKPSEITKILKKVCANCNETNFIDIVALAHTIIENKSIKNSNTFHLQSLLIKTALQQNNFLKALEDITTKFKLKKYLCLDEINKAVKKQNITFLQAIEIILHAFPDKLEILIELKINDVNYFLENMVTIKKAIPHEYFLYLLKKLLNNKKVTLDIIQQVFKILDNQDDCLMVISECNVIKLETLLNLFDDEVTKLKVITKHHTTKDIDALFNHFTTEENKLASILSCNNNTLEKEKFDKILGSLTNNNNKLKLFDNCFQMEYFGYDALSYDVTAKQYFEMFDSVKDRHKLFKIINNKLCGSICVLQMQYTLPYIMKYKRHKYLSKIGKEIGINVFEVITEFFSKITRIIGINTPEPDNCSENLISKSKDYFLSVYKKRIEEINKKIDHLPKSSNPYPEIITIDFTDSIFRMQNSTESGIPLWVKSIKRDRLLPITFNCKTGAISNINNIHFLKINNEPLACLIKKYAMDKYEEMIQNYDKIQEYKTLITQYENALSNL